MKCQTMSVKEAALYIGVSKDTVYELTRKKNIPHLRLGRRILFRKNALDIWMCELEKSSLKGIDNSCLSKGLELNL
ncbi:helix-turn-helix domain-containing protein [Priestia aryabhattai]|uniref:helix-turn-helix domain-containing protein n=1 Tax=Priestia TaxID=2800373 RepID=UPI001C8D84CF|nr:MULTISPECIES: helix-turn-helix domain-containing protein [Priestia]MBY0005739.1 helix-turn-helix domain-containing protein [Priestia aryabhattai]MBY0047580.1 helix-turn-helix domain-containing protein [Priestia aryabhattai]MDH3186682.1 helix-turn-helix domain-containing protein [Priestia megaterium]